MGKGRQLYKQNFLKKHPLCCFCGGVTPAEEIDHVPGRVFFRERQWPNGYEFPACIKCNRATRYEEKVIAYLARFNSDNEDETNEIEFARLQEDIAKHDPEFISDIRQSSANEIRHFLKERNIEKSAGIATSDISLVKIGDVVNKSVRKYGRKLFLALWFKHTGTVLPKLGGMHIAWMTNVSPEIDDTTLTAMFQILHGIPLIIKNSHHLHDQFTYRYMVTTSGDGAGFFVWFRQSFGLLCTMNVDRNLILHAPENIEVPF